jgi:hypothetical protein
MVFSNEVKGRRPGMSRPDSSLRLSRRTIKQIINEEHFVNY